MMPPYIIFAIHTIKTKSNLMGIFKTIDQSHGFFFNLKKLSESFSSTEISFLMKYHSFTAR